MSNMFFPRIGSTIRKGTNNDDKYVRIICIGKKKEDTVNRCENALK